MVSRNALEALSERANRIEPQSLQTEEAAKTSLVLPFIQALGYDVFAPREVVPEYTADYGTKQGEKVDYAIISDGKPIIIFECKKADDPLLVGRASQLFRYFTTTNAPIGVLTGGIRYKFFSDLDAENRMDENPFLEFDITKLDSKLIAELERFAKGQFSIEAIKEAAGRMRHIAGIREYLEGMHNQPDDELVRMIGAKRGYPGPGNNWTPQRLEYYTNLVKETAQGFIRDRIESVVRAVAERQSTDYAAAEDDAPLSVDDTDRANSDIVTTAEEQEAYEMVKAIVGDVVTPERVTIQDTKSYCAVVIDANSRQTICRFRFGARSKNIGFGPMTQEEKYSLESLANIADYTDRLRETAIGYPCR